MTDPNLARTFEDLLADPNEQYDVRSELLASILAYATALPASAGSKAWRPHSVARSAWLYTTGLDAMASPEPAARDKAYGKDE